jgi:S1-C subfamily serine protease
VERSEPDDDGVGEGAYPPAPLPAHERTWRHPSELGRAVWVHTEPPLTIGRGLLVTTGAIGGLLSIAVLWAMLPSAGRGGGQAAPTILDSTAIELRGPSVTVKADTLVATSVDTRLPTTTLRSTPVSTPKSNQSETTSTSAGEQPSETDVTQTSQLLETAPVAVGIGDSLIVTTARAVNGLSVITLLDSDGHPHDATVLMVDRDRGLAFLSADAASTTTRYGIGPSASPGDVVTVLGPTPTSANVGLDSAGHLTLDAWGEATPEGAPVVNADGLLVGICTHGDAGPELISVANVGAMLPTSKPAIVAPWLGVKVKTDDLGSLVVTQVDPESPAAAAGIAVGDVITAVGGVPVANRDQLKAAIAAHVPDDVVTLTITHAGEQSSADVAVTLGTAPSM